MSNDLLKLNTNMGGTSRSVRRMLGHEGPRSTKGPQHATLVLPCRNDIAKKAMLAVVLDLRPLSFT